MDRREAPGRRAILFNLISHFDVRSRSLSEPSTLFSIHNSHMSSTTFPRHTAALTPTSVTTPLSRKRGRFQILARHPKHSFCLYPSASCLKLIFPCAFNHDPTFPSFTPPHKVPHCFVANAPQPQSQSRETALHRTALTISPKSRIMQKHLSIPLPIPITPLITHKQLPRPSYTLNTLPSFPAFP